jgi:hypothetical protein
VYSKFTQIVEAVLLFTIFVEIRFTVGKFAVGSSGSTEAANRKPYFDENAIRN